MNRRTILKVLIIAFILVSVLAFAGCLDKGLLDANYIEVESLRVDDATIYLSPSGETSTFQLNVKRLPENATNVGLTYFIPSQYLEYVTVDSNGLISAKKEPEEEMRIPLTVTSTSNKKATLVIGLIIEYVEVDEIAFLQEKLELYYKSEPVQLGIAYQPYHAQDGRNITYSSLDPTIATVSASGILTPIKAGNTHILAVSRTMSGKVREARLPVSVIYAKSRYSLDVSDFAPKYKQTIGSTPQPITFTLSSLEPNADPNPRIQWYYGSTRETSMDDSWQYTHTPTLSTVSSYNVTVKVLSSFGGENTDEEQTFVSPTIYIYKEFSGFDFVSANQSQIYDENYLYGETATFEITSSVQGVDHYNWYLKRLGQASQGVLVGRTEATSFTKRLNIDGDYTLTAVGYNASSQRMEGQEQAFNFNVSRFVQGDTLVLTPRVLDDGIPPESYNWYVYSCDENGKITGGGDRLSNADSNVVIVGNTLYYKMTKNIDENIFISAKGVLNGTTATVDDKDFEYRTKPIKIFSKLVEYLGGQEDDIVDSLDIRNLKYIARTDSTINYLVIDGLTKDGKNVPFVYWQAVGGEDAYWVEITNSKGEVMLLNSTEYNDFGDNYCILPTSFVTLKDSFSIRVKQKGGQYTPYYYYGYDSKVGEEKYYFAAIEENHYSYLRPFSDWANNGFIRSIKELGAVLDYIVLYEPKVGDNSLVSVSYDIFAQVDGQWILFETQYTFKIYMEVEFADYKEFYPISVSTIGLDDIYVNLYKSLQAAQNAYCETGDMSVDMIYDQADGGYYVKIYKNRNYVDLIPPKELGEESTETTKNYALSPYGGNNNSFAIDGKQTQNVSTTDQLYNVVESGRQPVPQTTVTSAVYNKAKSVVNAIISQDMTDREKVLAFYDWLIINVEYDYEVLKLENLSNDQIYQYQAFHLEGVFLSYKAVCDGLAKAMSLLCWIEDIPSYKISGYVKGIGHAWNKVYIDGKWYVVDVTWGGTTVTKNATVAEEINYKYFMMTDAEFEKYYSFGGVPPSIFGEHPQAATAYNYYESNFINGYDTYITSVEEFATLLNSFEGIIVESTMLQVMLSEEFLLLYELSWIQIVGEVKQLLTDGISLDEITSGDYVVVIVTIKPTQ